MNGPIKILIIEDDEFVRFSLRELLEENEYSVTEAVNGHEGIKAAAKLLPDLIICDIMMPGINGLEVLHSLSQNIKTAVIPFIFLTALSDIRDLRNGMALGANDYIVKPYDSGTLLNSIKTRLKKIDSLKASIRNQNPDYASVENEKSKLTDKHLLFLENHTDAAFFKIEDIIYIEAQNVYTCIHNKEGKSITIRKILKQWEEHLPENFIRISRSVIINSDFISRTEKLPNRSYKVFLRNVEKPFNLSPGYKAILKTKTI